MYPGIQSGIGAGMVRHAALGWACGLTWGFAHDMAAPNASHRIPRVAASGGIRARNGMRASLMTSAHAG